MTGCGKSSGGDSGSGDSGSEDYIYRVGFVNIDNADQNCYPAMQNFVSYVESDEFEKSVGHPVEVLQADSALDVEKQSTNVETLLTKGIDMLFMIGVDTEGNNAAVEECNAENIPVYMVGTEASSGEWKFVGFDETEFGSIQGDWCVENLDEGENICYLEGTPGREATTKRKEGFEDAIAERDDLKILSSQTGEFDAEEAMNAGHAGRSFDNSNRLDFPRNAHSGRLRLMWCNRNAPGGCPEKDIPPAQLHNDVPENPAAFCRGGQT